MADETPVDEVDTARQERTATRRAEIRRLTEKGAQLFAELKTNGATRNALILEDLEDNPGAPARELAAAANLTVMRIYALRDKAIKARDAETTKKG
ncbi:hypothetical protein SEA_VALENTINIPUFF_87 [Microbacterium phage ValentiniPuff]|uniref:Uncharacterized protein n=1 Tax=Microbacterium phage ValentiniPuff TaxID=2315705 RepID=A0A386KPU8_9CAUD|nr:hypothetical protein SEA_VALENTINIPUFF_87 [Microbacterium phage ValentiniPuff]